MKKVVLIAVTLAALVTLGGCAKVKSLVGIDTEKPVESTQVAAQPNTNNNQSKDSKPAQLTDKEIQPQLKTILDTQAKNKFSSDKSKEFMDTKLELVKLVTSNTNDVIGAIYNVKFLYRDMNAEIPENMYKSDSYTCEFTKDSAGWKLVNEKVIKTNETVK